MAIKSFFCNDTSKVWIIQWVIYNHWVEEGLPVLEIMFIMAYKRNIIAVSKALYDMRRMRIDSFFLKKESQSNRL